jgi:hypothetical protein
MAHCIRTVYTFSYLLPGKMNKMLKKPPGATPRTFLDFPLQTNLDDLNAHIAIPGIPFGMPYPIGASVRAGYYD